MKHYINTYNGRVIKLDGLLYIDKIVDKYPTTITSTTQFDEEGNVKPNFTFSIVYENGATVSPIYEEIEEADQDINQILEELNKEN